MTRAVRLAALALAASLATWPPPPASAITRPQGIHAFVAAYPDFLTGIDKGHLLWRDGTRMPLSQLGLQPDGSPRVRYQPASDPLTAATEAISAVDYEPIFLKMYGDCRREDMSRRLATIQWNRGSRDGGMAVRAAVANRVAAALQRVSDAMDAMPPAIDAMQRVIGGTYVCRAIARSRRLSLHAFGIAIDVNPTEDGYWQTADTDRQGRPIWRNRTPMEVVEAFEREGFVWGGRWNQFDTFHFEYRPEYRIATGGAFPERLTRASFRAFFGGQGGAVVERRSYIPPGVRGAICHRWVRQPGKDFGRCLSVTIPAQKQRR